MTTYDRPVKATLHVHLENGESWEVTPDDLEKFGLVTRSEAYARFARLLRKALPWRHELPASPLNPLRYLAEVALVFPHIFEGDPAAYSTLLRDVGRMDLLLDQHPRQRDEIEEGVCGLPYENDPELLCIFPTGHGTVDWGEDDEGPMTTSPPVPGAVSLTHGAPGSVWGY